MPKNVEQKTRRKTIKIAYCDVRKVSETRNKEYWTIKEEKVIRKITENSVMS
jgi:hypothetical protein